MEESKKSNGGLVILIIILFIIILCLGGFIYLNKDKLFSGNEPDNQQVENSKLKLTDAVKERLNRFVDAGSNDNRSGSNVTATYFRNGVSNISDEIKTTMAFIGTKSEWREFTQDEAKNVGIDGVGFSGERIGVLKIIDFNSTYEEFFDNKPSDAIQLLRKIKTCPMMVINDNSSEIYLLSRCGGTSDTEYSKQITSYDSDTEYYYVHQTMTYTSPEFTTEYKIVWKFDKYFKFISTTKED